MPDVSQRPRARVDSARLPKGDLYETGRAEVRRMTNDSPPPSAPRRKEVSRSAKAPEPEEIDPSELLEVRGNDTSVPTREEIPELPLYGDEIEEMVDDAIARSTPSAPSQRSLRAATLPPPPPAFSSLRGNTLPGYPPPFPTEMRPSYPEASREDSGRRQRLPEPATVDHVREAAHGTSAEISQLREEIKQHITDEVASLRTSSYRSFQAPPSRASWLASIGRSAVEKVKSWWGSITSGSTRDTERSKEEPGLGETLRLLERAERDARDLPTMFLIGSLDRSALAASAERWEGTAASLQARKPSETPNVERRRSAIIGEKGLALQALLQSDRHALREDLPLERRRSLMVVQDQLPRHIHMLDTLRVGRDESRKIVAERALQALKSVVGGASVTDLAARAVSTCEAAARLPFAEVSETTKQSLAREYTQRLERIQKALGLRGELKDSLLHIETDLETHAPSVDWKKTGTDT